MVRKDVIAGVLELYDYTPELKPEERLNMVRKLVTKSIKSPHYMPWSVQEKTKLIELMGVLRANGTSIEESIDTAITCVYDAHVLGW